MKNAKTLLRLLAFALVCVMIVSSAACKPAGLVDNGSSTPAGSLILGDFLRLSAVGNDAANELVNNSGMSGIEANNHLAGTDSRDMYVFNGSETVVFSLARVESLGQLYIWNYSESGKTNCGVKELNVQYSVDGSSWQNLGEVTLNESSQSELDAYGGCVAANYGEPINFNGVAGKYVAITPRSNYGGDRTGLSEIRVFRHKIRPGDGYMVTGSVIRANKNVLNLTAGTTPEAALNNQGMSDLTSKTATHGNVPADMWYCDKDIATSYLVINLDGTYPIKELALWNYNDPANLGAGVKEFKVYYTVESPCDIEFETQMLGEEEKIIKETFDFSKGSWKELSVGGQNTFTLPQGDGSDALAASLVLTLDGVIQMQHVKIVPVSTYGGSGVGLSEVRFFAGNGWGVEPSREWTGVLSSSGSFDYQGKNNGRNGGWMGADGIFSINLTGAQMPGSLNENSRVFVSFQDTSIANMNNYKNFSPRTGYKTSHSGWVNMSWLFINGNKPDVRNVQFVLEGKDSDVHPYGNICAKHYWIGQTVLINGTVYGQACKYMGWDTPAGPEGMDILAIPMKDGGFADLDTVPEVVVDHVNNYHEWTGEVFANTKEAGAPDPDGYIYVFSKKSGKFVVSRCKPDDYINAGRDKKDQSMYQNWERWNGTEWVKDDFSKAFKTVKSTMSSYNPGNESNISYSASGPFAGKYINVFTEGSVGGQLKIGMSDNLIGKYTGPINEETGRPTDPLSLMWAPERYTYMLDRGYNGISQWNYNAKTQPALSNAGEMLITYHIGTQQTIDDAALEYTHPVFYNMFRIG